MWEKVLNLNICIIAAAFIFSQSLTCNNLCVSAKLFDCTFENLMQHSKDLKSGSIRS